MKHDNTAPLACRHEKRQLHVFKDKEEATLSSLPLRKCPCNRYLWVSLRSHPMYSSSKGTSEDRPLDAVAARTGPALAAAATAPEAARIIVLLLRSPRSLRALSMCLSVCVQPPSHKRPRSSALLAKLDDECNNHGAPGIKSTILRGFRDTRLTGRPRPS